MNLANNNITENHAENITQLLGSSVSILRYINLSDNYLTDESLENIEVTPHLRALLLTNNSIKNEGARVIMKLLHHNENLRRVDLSKNMVSIRYLNEIAKIMEKKRDHRELSKLQNVRQEIIDLKEELTTMPMIQKETRKVIIEKEKLLRQFYEDK